MTRVAVAIPVVFAIPPSGDDQIRRVGQFRSPFYQGSNKCQRSGSIEDAVYGDILYIYSGKG
jgi:hypothetical protein